MEQPKSWPSLCAASQASAHARQQQLVKPRGSLGVLESLAITMAGQQRESLPRARPAAALIFAADHPVVAHGVSAYPKEVTAAMVAGFARGGAAAAVLADSLGLPLRVIDVGVDREVDSPRVTRVREVADHRDVGDLREARAMSAELTALAIEAGAQAIDALDPRPRVVVLGEMGIGNTTAAAAITAALLDLDPHDAVGRGTGLDDEGLTRKAAVVRDALGRLRSREPFAVLAAVGGREIAALVGAIERAIERSITVIVDGFIVTSAALVLERMRPGVASRLVFGHRSAEHAHRRVLEALGARPLLDLDLRLGEASGGLLAFPLVELACSLHASMATFAEAAVPDRSDR